MKTGTVVVGSNSSVISNTYAIADADEQRQGDHGAEASSYAAQDKPSSLVMQGCAVRGPSILRTLEDVSLEKLRAHVAELTKSSSRAFFMKETTEALEYAENLLRGYGYHVSRDPFQIVGKKETIDLFNVVAKKIGDTLPEKEIVISAHIDSCSSNPFKAPGADDNASGVAALLELAKLLKNIKTRHSITFLIPQAEEIAHNGSEHYVEALQKENVLANINIDTIGFTEKEPKESEDIDIVVNEASRFVGEAFLTAQKKHMQKAHIKVTEDPKLSGSDHGSFWKKGIPAVIVSEGIPQPGKPPNPHMHTENDTMDKLHFPLIRKTTQLILAAILMLDCSQE